MDESEIYLDELKELDCGGQSKIYFCRMNSCKFENPMDVIAKEIDIANEELLHKELRCREFKHENIVQIYAHIKSPKNYIILEYFKLGNLEDLIHNHYDKLKIDTIQKIKGMIEGIDHIHSHKILHLDLHPKNILIAHSERNEITFKICDFGLSEEDDSRIIFKAPIGRAGYVSPEKVRMENISKASDIWSLGNILWKIFTAKEAFDFDNSLAIYYKVGQDLHPDIPINWPVQIQKILFYCWDTRCTTSKILKLFSVTTRNKKTEILLKRDMPLGYEWRLTKIDEKRIVPPIIWDCQNKNDRLSQYKFSQKEFDNFSIKFKKEMCFRKFKKIGSSFELLKYLNESGYFKNLKELNERFLDLTEMRINLLDAIENGKWIPIARALGMPDNHIKEIKHLASCEILDDIFEFWNEENNGKFSIDIYGLLKVFQLVNMDSS